MSDARTAESPSLPQALEAIAETFPARFRAATTEAALREEKAKLLGKKGDLTAALKIMGALPPAERKAAGERVNGLKASIEAAFDERLKAIEEEALAKELSGAPYDLTLPARAPAPRGHKHPIGIVRDEIVDIFRSLGFAVHDGPEVELEEYNFTKLGFPPDHPATDMQDSFWTTSGHLLRTHTSNVQIRAMLGKEPPFAFVAPGTVYRRDDEDATHLPQFNQLEGFLVDRRVSFAHLRGVLAEFAERLYGPGTTIRLRPSYFPFVEPGAEVDVRCVFCKGKGCPTCKGTGFIEILGCGMIHPVVFEHCGIDPQAWTGFAFGMGLERIALLRYGIEDIRLLVENDPRFLSQFR
jgi:phenylalanyl-tRNA synthetase alpha chain